MCTAGCELTPGLQPLRCSCGDHSARLQPEGKKQQKWECYAVKKVGNKPRLVTMRAEKLDARDVVAALCHGTYDLQNRPRAAATHSAHSTRKRDRTPSLGTNAPRATRIAGPGRGRKGERVTSEGAVDEAERVLKKPKPSEQEWRRALGRLTQEHKLLQQWCEQVALRCRIHHSIVNCSIVNYRAVAN